MKKITRVVAAMAIGATAIGIGIAPPAAADNCQTVGAATICGQGGATNGGSSAGAANAPAQGPASGGPGAANAPAQGPASGGCLTPYGTYQQCNAGHGHGG
jgi:hypothetical protein